jgi:hypothetical protein
MRPVSTGPGSVIDGRTLFEFAQTDHIVSARYAGGRVVLGVLVGILDAPGLTFRYAQVHDDGELHGGRSECELSSGPDGRLRLTERFTWDAERGSGVNVLEQVEEP